MIDQRLILPVWFLCIVFFSFSALSSENQNKNYFYAEPTDLLVDQEGKFLYVLCSGDNTLRKYPLSGHTEPVFLQLRAKPARMSWCTEKKRIAIAAGEANGVCFLVDAQNMTVQQTIRVGHSPSDVAVFQSTAWVCNRFNNNLSVINLDQGKEIARWNAGREPIAIDISPDGTKLVVANHLSEDRSAGGNIACRVRIFDTKTGNVRVIRLPVETFNLLDVAIEPDGRYAFFSCLQGHTAHHLSSIDGGWINENQIVVVDLEKGTYVMNYSLDGPAGNGSANPWGMSISQDGRFLLVAGSGTDEVHLINLPKLLLNLVSNYQKDAELGPVTISHIDFAQSPFPLKQRLPLGIKGIRQVVMHDDSIYCTGYFSDLIGRIDIKLFQPMIYRENHNTETIFFPNIPDSVYQKSNFTFTQLEDFAPFQGALFHRNVAQLGPKPEWTAARRGEVLFHDALICRLCWQSCISCHPDARADSLNWDLLNDGFSNPKNTKSMLLAHETPPCMATGIRKDAETAVRAGVHHIHFSEIPEEDYCAMDEYLKALTPVPSPHLVDGKLSESAKRGKKLFESSKTGCSNCHPDPYFTDFELHDVGTQVFQIGTAKIVDFYKKYDTPTLIEVWRTAPYLHDGRYQTIKELIVEGDHYAPDDRLKQLSEQEIDDLVEYVLSL